MPKEELLGYIEYAAPRSIEKELHVLEGILDGIAADRKINDSEIKSLKAWCDRPVYALKKNPFNELIPAIQKAIVDNILTDEEKEDLLWLCRRFTIKNALYDKITSDIQRLHGLLAGIAADNIISQEEIETLQAWIDNHHYLKNAWPFDEIDSLITSIMADHRIDDQEHHVLLNFCNQFIKQTPGMALDLPIGEELLRYGVCTAAPSIQFPDKFFCLSGVFQKGTKNDISRTIIGLGGVIAKSIRKDLDYLVIGGEGNECWAFSCYGRKVELAMTYRKQGLPIQLIHEFDFWDAAQDAV